MHWKFNWITVNFDGTRHGFSGYNTHTWNSVLSQKIVRQSPTYYEPLLKHYKRQAQSQTVLNKSTNNYYYLLECIWHTTTQSDEYIEPIPEKISTAATIYFVVLQKRDGQLCGWIDGIY